MQLRVDRSARSRMLNTIRHLVQSMRRRSVLTLLAALVCASSVIATQGVATVQPAITIQDFADIGVSLLPPTDPQFDARVKALIQQWTALAVAVKPHLVILSNRSDRTIVAYCISFLATDGKGGKRQNLVHFNYPNAVAGIGEGGGALPRGREVRPGEGRVIGPHFEIMPDVDNGWLAEYAKQAEVHLKDTRRLAIEIDAVIFEDGSLVGADTSELQTAFEKYLKVSQDIYRSIVANLEADRSIDEVMESEWAAAREVSAKDDTARDGFYRVQAVSDISKLRKQVGDVRVRQAFRDAIRQTPFVIKRVPSK